jgi:DNA polymerase III subunit delta'
VLGFASIKDQQRPVSVLGACIKADKLPHALLFAGPDGVGKRTAAMALAMAGNCTGARPMEGSPFPPVCGECRSCRKIQAGSHPDILSIEASGQFIRIAQIRDLLSVLAMKPYEARLRVVIISDAQHMNPEAGNALLKILEEPPERTVLILTAPETADLLPTIASRCQQIRFNPLTPESLADMLSKSLDIPWENARVLAAVSGGSYGRALGLHRQDWLEKRCWLIETLGCLDAAAARLPVPAVMSLAMGLAEKKDNLTQVMEILTTLYRDLAIGKHRRDGFMNEDLSERILAAAGHMDESGILDRIEAIETAGRQLRGNANLRLTAERLFLRLAGYNL